jgi:hypothetical protein
VDVSGSKPEPGQLTPPMVLATLIDPKILPSGITAGTNGACSQRYFFRFSRACVRRAGVKSITSSGARTLRE